MLNAHSIGGLVLLSDALVTNIAVDFQEKHRVTDDVGGLQSEAPPNE